VLKPWYSSRMRLYIFIIAILFSTLSAAGELEAAEAPPPAKVQPALTVGLMELVGLANPPPHLGLFVLASLDLLIPLNENWTLIPSNGFEFAPDNQNWGGFSFLIFDRVLTEKNGTLITIEPQLGIVHNAVPLGDGKFDHAFYPTAGVGFAFIGAKHTWIPTLTTSVGLKGEGLSQGLILYYSKAL
jgi:hypothetical protein